MTKLATLAVSALTLAAVARAELVALTYTEYVRSVATLFQEVAKARGLDAKGAAAAERMATAWVWGGPCKGKPPGKVNSELQLSAIRALGDPHPALPIDAAILEMVAILVTKDSLGRHEMSETACRFALETAEPYVKAEKPRK